MSIDWSQFKPIDGGVNWDDFTPIDTSRDDAEAARFASQSAARAEAIEREQAPVRRRMERAASVSDMDTGAQPEPEPPAPRARRGLMDDGLTDEERRNRRVQEAGFARASAERRDLQDTATRVTERRERMAPSGTISPVSEVDVAASRAAAAVTRMGLPGAAGLTEEAVRGYGDTLVATSRALPQTFALMTDVAQLLTAGNIGADSGRALRQIDASLGQDASAESRSKAAVLAQLVERGDAAGVAAFLMANPKFALDTAIPSMATFIPAAGGGIAAAQLVNLSRAARALPAAERAAIQAGAATAGSNLTNTLLNAGNTYAETGSYDAAGTAGVFSMLAGRLFKGGAEGALARGTAPGALRIMGREAGQEATESLGQSIGQQTAENRFEPAKAGAQAALEGTLGAIGGGLAGAVLDREQPALPPVPSAREVIDRSFGPRVRNFAEPDSPSAQAGLTPIVVPEQTANRPDFSEALARASAGLDRQTALSPLSEPDTRPQPLAAAPSPDRSAALAPESYGPSPAVPGESYAPQPPPGSESSAQPMPKALSVPAEVRSFEGRPRKRRQREELEFGESKRREFLRMLRSQGGVKADEISDVLGSRDFRAMPALFKRGGVGTDEIARNLIEAGYLPFGMDPLDAVERTRTMIAEAVRGEAVMRLDDLDELAYRDYQAQIAEVTEGATVELRPDDLAGEVSSALTIDDLLSGLDDATVEAVLERAAIRAEGGSLEYAQAIRAEIAATQDQGTRVGDPQGPRVQEPSAGYEDPRQARLNVDVEQAPPPLFEQRGAEPRDQQRPDFGLGRFNLRDLDEVRPEYREIDRWRPVPAAARDVDTTREVRRDLDALIEQHDRNAYASFDAETGNIRLGSSTSSALLDALTELADRHDLGVIISGRGGSMPDLPARGFRRYGASVRFAATGQSTNEAVPKWVRRPAGALLYSAGQQQPRTQRRNGPAQRWQELAASVGLTFQKPRPFRSIEAAAEGAGLSVQPFSRTELRDAKADARELGLTVTAGWHIGPGKLLRAGDVAWVDLSGLEPGQNGAAITDLAADYALAEGIELIGDPAGAGPVGVMRLAEHYLASALKHGTTRHLQPPMQAMGMFDDNASSASFETLARPLAVIGDWGVSDADDTAALMRFTLDNVRAYVPEIDRIRIKDGRFVDERGRILTDERFAAFVREARATPMLEDSELGPTEPPIGVNTIKRAAVSRLVLEQRESRAAGDGGLPLEQARKIVRELLGPAQTRVELVEAGEAPADAGALLSGAIEGFYDTGTDRIVIFTDSIAPQKDGDREVLSAEDRLRWVVVHELTHRGANVVGSKAYRERLSLASMNPVVRALADAISAERNVLPATIATEEALAELAAAQEVGSFEALTNRYGVEIEPSTRLRALIKLFTDAVRRLVEKALGRKAPMPLRDVLALVRELTEAGKQSEGVTSRDGSLASTADGVDRVGELWRELAQDPDTFRYTMPVSDDFPSILREMGEGSEAGNVTVRRVPKSELAEFDWLGDNRDRIDDAFAVAGERIAGNATAYVFRRGREVWIDVSRFKQGQGGDLIYQAAAAWAHNKDRVFIGDPAGLSALAVYRRTENMLSSALRFGTTRHLMPAAEQMVVPEALEGRARPIEWVPGIDTLNLRQLLVASARNIQVLAPEIRDVVYDLGRREFVYRPSGDRRSAAERGVGAELRAAGLGGADSAITEGARRAGDVDGRGDSGAAGGTGRLAPVAGAAFTDADFEALARQVRRDRPLFDYRPGGKIAPPIGVSTMRRAVVTSTLLRLERVDAGRRLLDRFAAVGLESLRSPRLRGILYSSSFERERSDFKRDFTGQRRRPGMRASDLRVGNVKSEAGVDLMTRWFDAQYPLINAAREAGDEVGERLKLAIEAYPGRVSDRLDRERKALIEPFTTALGKSAKRLDMRAAEFVDAYGLYRYARHADERNRELRRRGSEVENPSGMSREEAQQWLRYFNSEPKLLAEFEALDDQIARIQQRTDEIRLGAKLLTGRMIAARPDWRHYVSLQGDPFEGDEQGRPAGAGWHEETIETEGRSTLAMNPIVNTVKNLELAVKQAEHQRVKDAVVAFVRKHGQVIDARIEPLETGEDADGSITYWEGDQRYRIVVGSRRFLNALKGLNIQPYTGVEALAAKFTFTLGRLYTQFSPHFPLVNFLRDVQQQVAQILGTEVRIDGKLVSSAAIAARLVSRLPMTFGAAVSEVLGRKPSGKYTRMARELIEQGGLTGFSHAISDVERVQDLVAEVKKAAGQARLRQSAEAFVDVVQGVTDVFELTTRVAVHSTLRDMGMDAPRAANFAKGLMNFNKAGTQVRKLAPWYLFIRPAFQDVYKTSQLLRTKKGAAVAFSMFMGAVMLYTMLRALSGPDEDNEDKYALDKRNPGELRNFIVLPLGGDEPIRIPVGFGLPRITWGLAVTSVNAIDNPDWGWKETTDSALKSFTSNMSPIQLSEINLFERPFEWGLTTFAPSVAVPIVELATNRSRSDVPITSTRRFDDRPDYARGRDNTPKEWKDAARLLYEGTQGRVDVAPETLAHLFRQYGGGPAGVVAQWLARNEKERGGEPVTARDFPVAGAFVGPKERYTERRFREADEETSRVLGRFKELQQSDQQAAARMLEDNRTMQKIILGREIDEILQTEGRYKAMARRLPDYAEQRRMLREIDDALKRVKKDTVRRYNDERRP